MPYETSTNFKHWMWITNKYNRGRYATWHDNQMRLSLKKKKWGDFQCNPFNLFRSGMGGVVVIIPIRVIKTSLCMCQRTAAFLFFLPLHRVSKASAHYKPISLYQLIFTFDSVAVLMGVGTRVSVHRNLNNVMKPGADLIYNPMPWLNSIMSFSSPLFVGNKGKLRL